MEKLAQNCKVFWGGSHMERLAQNCTVFCGGSHMERLAKIVQFFGGKSHGKVVENSFWGEFRWKGKLCSFLGGIHMEMTIV